jgi:hypothetical protein
MPITNELRFREALQCYNAKMNELDTIYKEIAELSDQIHNYTKTEQYRLDRAGQGEIEYLLAEEMAHGSKGKSIQSIQEIADEEEKKAYEE